MQIDIAQHIEKLLFEHETVIVPTFGGFTATRSPASLDAVGGTIAPPSKTLAFNENLTVDDGILVHDIAHSRGISEDEARLLAMDFVEKTKEALDQREIVTLPGIGRLYKNYAQKVQFLPDTTNFNTDSFGLPKIQFSSVPRGASDAQTVAAPAIAATEQAVTANSNGSTNVASTAVPEMESVQEVAAEVQPENVPTITETVPEVAPVTREVKKPFLTPARLAAAGVLAAAVGVATFFFFNSSPNTTDATPEVITTPSIVPGMGDVVAADGIEKENAELSKDDDATGDISEDADEYESKKMEAEAQLNKVAKTTSKSSTKKAPPGTRRCVLIVGTFRKKGNATKILNKLKAADLDTYHRFSKGHQVGIEFYYKNYKEVQEKMKQLQSITGEDNIWIKKK